MIKWLNTLADKGIFFKMQNGQLKMLSKAKTIDKELLLEIKEKKPAIIEYLQSQSHLINAETEFVNIPKVAQAESYALSDAQKRIWILTQLEEESLAYNIPFHIPLNDCNIDNFKKAVNAVIERHEILRTIFKLNEAGEIRQWILPSESINFTIDTVDFRNTENAQTAANEYIHNDSKKAFKLSEAPLLRAALLQLEDDKYIFHCNMHHIISDGWSMDVLIKDVMSYYNAFEKTEEAQLATLPIQYKDFAAWQLEQMESESYQAHKEYWKNQFSGELPVLDFPTNNIRPAIKTSNGQKLTTFINADVTSKLTEFVQAQGGSLFTGLLAVTNIALHKYSSQEEFTIGTPMSGREHKDLENQIGFYVNTLALRNKVEKASDFIANHKAIKENTLQAFGHQAYSFDRLIEELDIERNTSRNALFDVMVVMQNNAGTNKTISNKESNTIKNAGKTPAKFDMELSFEEVGNAINFSLVYNTDIYEEETIKRFINHFKEILKKLVNTPATAIENIEYLSEEETKNVIVHNNDTQVKFPALTVLDAFKAQVAKNPTAIAVEFEKTQLSYGELDTKSTQLANHLATEIAAENTLVPLLLDRSSEMIIVILAILKTGNAYVPIDATLPKARIEHIIKDTAATYVITTTKHKELVNSATAIALDTFNFTASADKTLQRTISNTQNAYCIYTSGSTGTPKGVVITHEALYNYTHYASQTYTEEKPLTFVLFTSISFDLTITSIFTPLTTGGKIHVLPESDNKLENLERIPSLDFDVIKLTPSHLNVLLDFEASQKLIYQGEKKVFILGGEALPKETVNNAFAFYGNALTIWNEYGPTEATVGCISKNIQNGTDEEILIGKPTTNVQIYILDANQKIVPVGVSGEIYIGGKQLAAKYLNNEALTDEKFVQNPFNTNERLYKTGDYGKWLADGNIAYLGRKDEQIKIRGHRIEVGEIENALLTYNGITKAAVIVAKDAQGDKELWAYITNEMEVDTTKIQQHLQQILPSYMNPAKIFSLESLPLTTNGKIDKKELLKLEANELNSGVEYIAPRGEIEAQLVKIWATLLNKEASEIGIDNGFFEAGGNSLKIISLKTEIEKIFNKDISVAILFQNTTIRQQASLFDGSISEETIEETTETIETPQLQQTKESMDVAVIGMAIKTPGASNVEEFWDILKNGKEPANHFTEEELKTSGVSKQLLNNKNYVRSSFYMKERDVFDAAFFGYMPAEARLLDPQTRLLHEIVWSAIEDAAHDPLTYKGSIGLYAGNKANLNWMAYNMMIGSEDKIDDYTASYLQDKDFANSLIAYKLNLKGAVNAVNTACSTSLVAIHHAAKSVLAGENDIAVAGGVSLKIGKKEGYIYQEGMISSSDGHTRTFDAKGKGTVGSEGAGAVVLKRLDKAIADGDNILAVIKGSAINNDGNRKVGYTAPSIDGQIQVIKKAQRAGKIQPETISYVEAHGTATKLGDVIEFEALRQVFGSNDEKYCGVGSVKSNMGHLDTAAGVAGLIKTVLCLQHQKLAPSLHFETPNPELKYEESNLYVIDELQTWKSSYNGPRRAGVSSFGIGGTNAHVVLEEYETIEKVVETSKPQIFTLSGKTPEALQSAKENLATFLQKHENVQLANAAWTLQTGRSAFKNRMSFTATSTATAIEKLENNTVLKNKIKSDDHKKMVFMFSGQGSQYVHMGKDLYASEEVFKQTMDECFAIAEKINGKNYKNILFSSEDDVTSINETKNTQPILFIFEYALAKQLMHYGVQPNLMIGHSIGEYVVACLSGVFSLEDAIKIVIKRGELIQSLPSGSMIGVALTEAKAKSYLTENISIATINTKDSCTFSGTDEAITTLSEQLKADGITYQPLKTSHAFHSNMMEPILEEFTSFIETITINRPNIPYISNVTGKEITASEVQKSSYWAEHIRKTVRFAEGLETIVAQHSAILLEVGPGKTLHSFAKPHATNSEGINTCNLVRHPKETTNDTDNFYNGLGKLWTFGASINWKAIHEGEELRKISMPTYAFEKTVYPVAEDFSELYRKGIANNEIRKTSDITKWFYKPTWERDNLTVSKNDANNTENKDYYLVFLNENDFNTQFVSTLEETTENIIKIYSGDKFEKRSERIYQIDITNAEDYQNIIDVLATSNIHPKNIIQLFNINDSVQLDNSVYKQQGFYSLLHLAKALSGIKKTVQLSVVTSQLHKVFGNEESQALTSLIEGILIVMSQENPQVIARNIDVASSEVTTETASQIINEINSSASDKFVAYRMQNRWIKKYNQIQLDNATPTEDSKLKTNGVYLITGGLGSLGAVFAEYLIEEYNASLILMGRTEVTENDQDVTKYNRLQQLIEKGNVAYFKANVSDATEMKNAIDKGTAIFGEIQGVIHTAGVISGKSIRRGIHLLQEAEGEQQFEAKVTGVQVLTELFKDKTLDFCIFSSSLATVIGGKEFAAYASANAYLDYVANAQLIKNAISLNFDGLYFEGETDDLALDASEMKQVLAHALATISTSQLVISVAELPQRIQKWTATPETVTEEKTEEVATAKHQINRDEISTPYATPEKKTEKELHQLFEDFFEVSGIGIDDDFFEIGGDSLKAMTISNSIHKIFNVELDLKDFFMNPDIRSLAKEIDFNVQINNNKEVAASTKFEDII